MAAVWFVMLHLYQAPQTISYSQAPLSFCQPHLWTGLWSETIDTGVIYLLIVDWRCAERQVDVTTVVVKFYCMNGKDVKSAISPAILLICLQAPNACAQSATALATRAGCCCPFVFVWGSKYFYFQPLEKCAQSQIIPANIHHNNCFLFSLL